MTYTIDVIYWIPITLLSIAIIAALLRRAVNFWIGLMGLGLGAVLTYYASPYTQYAIIPIRNWAFYGTEPTWHLAVAIYHVASLIFISLIAVFNLWSSKGYSLWLMALPQAKAGASFRETMTSLRNNEEGIVISGSLFALAVIGILAGTAVAGWAVYRFFQAPEITYNITNPPESAWPHIFEAGGLGLNFNVIVIAISVVAVLYLFLRVQRD